MRAVMNVSAKNFRQTGFTLIEIMVVVVIIGLLVGLIGPKVLGRAGDARMTAAKSDISNLGRALDIYKLDNYSYPNTDQGLQALVTEPSGEPEARNWNPDGYLPKVPNDPWGTEYIYMSPGVNGGKYDLYTLGADGREGGEGEAADVNSWEL
jgi:general secretion pathway protein G